MKILLFVSQDINIEMVTFFAEKPGVDLMVVTQVTQRDRIYGYKSAIPFCKDHNIPCIVPNKLDEKFLQQVRAFQPDICVTIYFPQIFPKALLEIPRLGTVNVHPGDLPKQRGTFPLPWMILQGETEGAISIHYVTPGIDTGDILLKKKFHIESEETGFQLYKRAMYLSAQFLRENFDKIVSGTLTATRQIGVGSYFNKLEPQYHMDWHQSVVDVSRRVRVHARPYLPCFTYLYNKCVYINKVTLIEIPGYTANVTGCIVRVFPDRKFAVSCVDGCVLVEKYDVFPPIENEEQFDLHFHEGAKLE